MAIVLRRVMRRQIAPMRYTVLFVMDMTTLTVVGRCLNSPSPWPMRYVILWLDLFFHIPHAPLPRKKDSKNALVSVVGGMISKEQLIL